MVVATAAMVVAYYLHEISGLVFVCGAIAGYCIMLATAITNFAHVVPFIHWEVTQSTADSDA